MVTEETNFEITCTKDGGSANDSISEIEKEFMDGFDILQSHHIDKQSAEYFYISDIGLKCIRLKYYSIIEPRKIRWEKKRKYAVNAGIHKEFQLALEAKGWNIEKPKHKKYSKLGFEVSAKFDATFGNVDKPDKLIEIKVPWFFSHLDNPYEPNVHQIQQYMDILELDEGTLVYIDAFSGKSKSFRVFRDDKLISRNLEKLEDVRYALLKKVLPEKTRSYTCSDCLYKVECKANINLGIKS